MDAQARSHIEVLNHRISRLPEASIMQGELYQVIYYYFHYFCSNTDPHLLQIFRRMLQCCFAGKFQKCFVANKISSDFPVAPEWVYTNQVNLFCIKIRDSQKSQECVYCISESGSYTVVLGLHILNVYHGSLQFLWFLQLLFFCDGMRVTHTTLSQETFMKFGSCLNLLSVKENVTKSTGSKIYIQWHEQSI